MRFHRRSIAFIALAAALAIAAGGCARIPASKGDVDLTPISGTPSNTSPQAINRAAESYKIYSVVFANKWKNGNIVVREVTDRGLFQNDDWLEKNLDKSNIDAIDDFKKANETGVRLENRFDYDGKLALISQDDFKKTIGDENGWDQFHKLHESATGIVTFSAVGFDRTGMRALVNVSYLCGSHCGHGNFFVLEKRDGEWTISKEMGTWIS